MTEPLLSPFQPFDGLLLFIGGVFPFLWIRGALTKDMLMLFFHLTQNVRTAHQIHLFFVFPGVFLHEFSHWLVLRLLGVKCSLHLGIEMQADFVVYGHVDYYENDVSAFKHFLSGIAPMINGMLATSLLAVNFMGLPAVRSLVRADTNITLQPVIDAMAFWPFWLAFYLIFAITSEMVPSPSDRKYWLPLALIFLGLSILSIVTQTSTWLFSNIYPYLNNWLKIMGIVFLISLLPQLILWLPFRLLHILRRQH